MPRKARRSKLSARRNLPSPRVSSPLPRSGGEGSKKAPAAVSLVLRIRLSLLMFLLWAVPGALVPLYSVRLKEVLHFDELTLAVCCATQAAATAASSLVAGQVADRWLSAEKAMSACAVLAGLALWLLADATEPASVFFLTLL